MWLNITLITIGALFFCLIAIVLIRALTFKPKKQITVEQQTTTFNEQGAIDALGELIKCKTVSDANPSKENPKEFEKLITLLPKLYPEVYTNCDLKTFDGRGLLFRWKGKNDNKPSVLMAHYDVVSVVEELWQKPPFSAIIENGEMWGRGALDTKVTFNGALYAANHLIKEGFVPENDIYLAFSGTEEINGIGALKIVEYFKENGITPEMVIDEGGAVLENVFPGVKKPCALIGVAEKGMLNLKYTVKSNGGHSSAPKPNSPLVRLSKACCAVEKNYFKCQITKPVAELFDTLGRESTFLYKIIFANLWLFKGVLNILSKKTGGDMNALLRTTVAFTKAEGSQGINVLPPVASIYSNSRINPMDTIDSTVAHLNKVINDEKVQIEIINGNEPSKISRTDTQGYERVVKAIKSTWDNVLTSPYLMVQCSDSRHYDLICDRVYRFSAMALTSEERATIHGNNERIKLEKIVKTVEFYINLIKLC